MGTNGRMIAGELGELARPLVDCSLSLPRLGVYAEIIFLVDTGADATYLHLAAGSGIGIPSDLLQRRVTSRGIGGNATYFPEPGYPAVRRPRSPTALRLSHRHQRRPAWRRQRPDSVVAGVRRYPPLADGLRPDQQSVGIYGSGCRFHDGRCLIIRLRESVIYKISMASPKE